MKKLVLLFGFILVLGACATKNSPKTIYIVRHAEKQLEGEDPQLAYVGEVRAGKLMDILADQEIKHVFSTGFNRTRLTASPTANAAGLEIEIYDPKDPKAFSEILKSIEGNVLVVGHSNTVSQLANQFVVEGENYEDLTDLEYDYIYVVTLDGNSSKVERKVYKDF